MLDEAIKLIIEETVNATLLKIGATAINKREQPEIMNTKELAEYLNVSLSYIYQNKDIPCEKRGRKLMYNKNEVDAWRNKQRELKKPINNKIAATINKSKIYKIG